MGVTFAPTSVLICIRVILTLFCFLFFGRNSAIAQIDSNYEVVFHNSSICDGCNMMGSHFERDGNGTTFSVPLSICVEYLDTFACNELNFIRYSKMLSSGSDEIEFSIDTNNHLLRNFRFVEWHGNIYSPCSSYSDNSALDSLMGEADSISYIDSSGVLIAEQKVALKLSFGAEILCGTLLSGYEGFCGNIQVSADTITIRIVPKTDLAVGMIGAAAERKCLKMFSDADNIIVSISSSSQETKVLQIYDFLGRIAAKISTVPNANLLELPIASLPPGCYFARLGDQVAKFIVPPR